MRTCNKRVAQRLTALLRPGIILRSRRSMTTRAFQVSERVRATDEPCIVKSKQMMLGVEGAVSLAQGVVHWTPPKAAVEAMQNVADTGIAHSYGPAEGMPSLREELQRKVASENGLTNYSIMVTAGANQAFVNVLLSLTDSNDGVVLFKPYYFNHLMAVQMTGGSRTVVLGEPDPNTLKPDLAWLSSAMSSERPPKLVVLVNPSNPAGYVMSEAELWQAQRLCERAGAWLVVDNTYEHFVYGVDHACIAAPNVLHIFSFSKAYGMMGWRVGYIAFPGESAAPGLGAEILKVQDTIPICATQVSQVLALEAVRQGRDWVRAQVHTLEGRAENRQLVLDAVASVLGPDAIKSTSGSIYFFVKLPDGVDDEALVQRLISEYKVVTIPGASCGSPGYFRVAYANCTAAQCAEACERLRSGLAHLVAAHGP